MTRLRIATALAAALLSVSGALVVSAQGSGSAPAAPPAKPFDHREAFRQLPPENFLTYLPEKYAACIPCHPRPVFEDEDFNVDTNWRDTTMGKNLHGLHVYRQPDGVNCAVCHVWDKAAERIAFGERIRVTVTKTGGSCTPACHRPKKYHNAGRL